MGKFWRPRVIHAINSFMLDVGEIWRVPDGVAWVVVNS